MNKPSIKAPFDSSAAGGGKKATSKALAPYSIRFTNEERARLDQEAGNSP